MERKKYRTGKIIKINEGQNEYSIIINNHNIFAKYNKEIIEIAIPKNEKEFIFKVNDIIKYDENNITDIDKIPTATFDYDELQALANEAEEMDCDQIIETHKSVMDHTDTGDIFKGTADENFLEMLINYNRGYCIPKEMPEEFIKFFNSEYISIYLRALITTLIKHPNEKINELLNGEKNILTYSGEEWDIIYKALYESHTKDQYFYDTFLSLAFYINTDGAKDFLNNYVDPCKLVSRIMITSGLNDRGSYYAGRGVNRGDLNEEMLFAIYKKLYRLENPNTPEEIEKSKAKQFSYLVLNMDSLGATEFINSFYAFARNNFKYREDIASNDNCSIYDIGEKPSMGAFIGMFASTMYRNSSFDDYETRNMKSTFIVLIDNFLKEEILKEEEKEKELKRL